MLEWIDPRFGPVGSGVAAGVVLLLALSVLRATPARMRRMDDALRAVPDRVVRFHRRMIIRNWTVAAACLVPLLTDPGVHLDDLGLADVHGAGIAAAAGMLAVTLPAFWWRNRIFAARVRAGRGGRLGNVMLRVSVRLPRDRRERWWAAASAVSIGIGEEIVFRGLLLAAGVGVLGLSPLDSALLGAVVFGVCHGYQGLAGVLGTALFGLAAALLYALSGNLLLAIALHVALDLAAFLAIPHDLAVPPPPVLEPGPAAAPAPATVPRLRPAAPR